MWWNAAKHSIILLMITYDIRASDIDVNESWLTELNNRDYDAIRQENL